MPIHSRKKQETAKKFAILSVAGFVFSGLVFYIHGSELGIFCAVVCSTIPSLVNLMDG